MPPLPLTTVFDGLTDPRRETENKLHRLTDVLAITTCAVIGGAETWEAIAEYGRTKADFFRRFLTLENGIPSADTFGRVFARLAPGAFAQAFGRWMATACEATGLVPIAIDGKSARGAKRNTATGCVHVVTAWATENRLALGQVAVPDGSNEIGAIPDLLRVLDFSGAIVTIDAAGCQTENARLIRSQGGHYLLAVKDNQPTLRAAVERVVEAACEAELVGMEGDEQVDDAHGRHEERYVGVFKNTEGIPAEWPDVAAVVQVNREREVGGVRTCTSHYYLNLGIVRRVAVSLLERADTKGSIQTRRMKAAWDDDYMLKVLQEIGAK
ncbi:ISAs1 family transposase [Gemmata sp.]|uniref:ISAs1 family transposase n=1 Tax=Gemmata sp. TaxID=1914242 RepID=UPI003F6FB02B